MIEIDIIKEVEALQDEARQLLSKAISTLIVPATDSDKKVQIENSFEAITKLAIANQKLNVLKAKLFYKPIELPVLPNDWSK